MTRIALLCLALVACGDNLEPTTWGTVSNEFAAEFCDGLGFCGWIGDADRGICIEHTAWHLCAPDHTCEVQVDPGAAERALAACAEAFDAPAYRDPYSRECIGLGIYGFVPSDCYPIFDLDPAE